MNGLETFFDILKYIVPSIILLAAVYLLVAKFLEDNQARMTFEFKKANREMINPVRLQAYERIILFLERISLQQLIMNHSSNAGSATALRALMLKSVTDEFNYNLSQQIYMSHQAWDIIRVVKEQIISMINHEYEKMSENASAADFSKSLISRLMKEGVQPTQKAIDFVKTEVNLYFS